MSDERERNTTEDEKDDRDAKADDFEAHALDSGGDTERGANIDDEREYKDLGEGAKDDGF